MLFINLPNQIDKLRVRNLRAHTLMWLIIIDLKVPDLEEISSKKNNMIQFQFGDMRGVHLLFYSHEKQQMHDLWLLCRRTRYVDQASS